MTRHTMTHIIPKPEPGEYAPYTVMYFDVIPDDGLVLDHLRDQVTALRELVAGVDDRALSTPHAPGEWTIKQILLHIIDDERIYAYRALRIARGDQTDLPGFEQDDYIEPSQANTRSIDSLLHEFETVRHATLSLFENLPEDALVSSGVANGHRMSVRAAAYHIAGHAMHHIVSIRENYG